MTITATCPSWCTEHHEDPLDLGAPPDHYHRIQTDIPGASLYVVKEQPGAPLIDLDVSSWQPLTAAQGVELINAITQAVWIADPELELPPSTADEGGLWAAVGRTVRKLTGAAGLSQTDLAMLLGITQPDVSNIIRGVGVRTFSLPELAAIAEILGLTLTELVEEIETAQ